MQNFIQLELEDVVVVVSMGVIKSFCSPKKMVILNNPHTRFSLELFLKKLSQSVLCGSPRVTSTLLTGQTWSC